MSVARLAGWMGCPRRDRRRTLCTMMSRRSVSGEDPNEGRHVASAVNGHRTVSRVTAILEAVATEPDGVRLTALTELLEAPKSSVFSLVKGLVNEGYLREESGRYHIGPAIAALLVAERPNLGERLHGVMSSLRNLFDETVMLATAVGDSIVYVAKEESHQLIRYSAPLHVRRPLYPTTGGTCLLAARSTARQERYLQAHFATAAERAAVREELQRVRERGVAFNRGQTVADVCAAGALVGTWGRPVAALSVAGPVARLEERLDEVAIAVSDGAVTATELLGLSRRAE